MANAMVPELAVRDWRASLAFYRDVLGFTLVYDRPLDGFAFLELGAAQLMIDQIGIGRTFGEPDLLSESKLGLGINLQIRVDRINPLLDRLARAGIALYLPSEERRYVVSDKTVVQRQFVVADPDGYLLRFCE